MNIVETNSSGLKYEFKVTVEKSEIEMQIEARLADLSKRVRLPGFRPGKIPMGILKARYGDSVMGEVIEKAVHDTSHQAMAEKKLQPALKPKIEVTSFAEGGDLEYTLEVEVLPEIEAPDLSSIKLEKPVFKVEDKEVDETINRLAERYKSSEPVEEKRAAKMGDILQIDFKGSVDGEAKPGMDGQDFDLELGSHSFIDTFEDQLVGAKPGDHVTVNVRFPEQYHSQDLAGKAAVFEVDVKTLKKSIPAAIDDDFAKKLGIESLEKLRETVREQLQDDYDGYTKLRLKRALLDKLAEKHKFGVPQGMVDAEFEAIWKQIEQEMKSEDGEAKGEKDEEALKAEYRDIADRRVRLGLLLNEIGKGKNLQVTKEEINRAIMAEAQNYPGQERKVIEFYRKNPQMIESLRAPLYEDKVVSYVLTQVKLDEKPVSKEELIADPDDKAA
jgi:trigger factor